MKSKFLFSRMKVYEKHEWTPFTPCIMCVQYIGGISWVHRGDIMMNVGGYHEYIRGCSVHQRDMMIHVGEQLDKILSISIENSNVLNIPLVYSWYPQMYSWYPSDVLNISLCTHSIPPNVLMISPDVLNTPQCTQGIPLMYSWYPPDVLMVSPRCTHDIPLMYSWYPPDVFMVSPRCTHGIPPMYWTSPDVLNTHYTGWFTVSWYLIWF